MTPTKQVLLGPTPLTIAFGRLIQSPLNIKIILILNSILSHCCMYYLTLRGRLTPADSAQSSRNCVRLFHRREFPRDAETFSLFKVIITLLWMN